jgi:hypothetical protein
MFQFVTSAVTAFDCRRKPERTSRPRLTRRQRKAAKAAALDPRNPALAIALALDCSIKRARTELSVLETKGAL